MTLRQLETHTHEAYHKILSNLANAKSVWGASSPQYRECEAMAAEYNRLLQIQGRGDGQVLTKEEPRGKQEVTTNLVFRSRLTK